MILVTVKNQKLNGLGRRRDPCRLVNEMEPQKGSVRTKKRKVGVIFEKTKETTHKK